MLAVGFVLGLIVSLSLVFSRIFLRRGIESPEQLEEIGINVYASIPVAENSVKKQVRSNDLNKRLKKNIQLSCL